MNLGTVVALIKSLAPGIDPATVEGAVSDWLDDHPDATTTVADGSITVAKLSSALQEIIDNVAEKSDIPDVSGFYTKPLSGIPASDLASGVIPDVSGFYTKPASGIPASDLASGVIPTVHNVPSGGSSGQVLAKNSGTDYDVHWVNQSGGGGGSSGVEALDSTKTGVDLDVSDPSGNVILRLADGHIQTKEFDSRNISEPDPSIKQSTKTGVDLDISDDDGNVILRLQGGNIKTLNFDSSKYIEETVVTVKKDGTGDFTTLRGAIDSITDASRSNPYRIEIYPGTYNVMDDYTDAEIREADVPEYHQGFAGPMLTDGISLVGIGCRDDIIIYGTLDPDTYDSTIRGNISTLNTAGTMRLENLTVVSYRLRYCVHDDFYAPNNTETYDRVVKNCRFDMQRNVNTSSDDSIVLPNAYGAGMNGKGMNAYFENCDFSTGLGIHTSGSNSAFPTRTIVQNCRGYAFRPNDRDETSVHFEFIVNNCDFDIVRYGHYTDPTNQVFYISGSGNNKTMLNCSATDEINIGDRTRHKNTMNLPVLTMVKRNGSTYEMTTDKAIACGIIVLITDEYAYIQRGGFINSNILGMSGLAVGDYITVDSSGVLTTTGAEASNAVGVVTDIDEYSVAYMKMLVGEV